MRNGVFLDGSSSVKLSAYIENLVEQFNAAELHYGHGTDNAFDEAIYLVYGILGIDFMRNLNEIERELTASEQVLLNRKAQIRITERIPVAYLINQAWFAGMQFNTDERALVPRSPIAELILNSFDTLIDTSPQLVLDLCCGGGCIGVAIANQFQCASVELADINKDALALAQENIALHGLDSRVRVVNSNLFSNIENKFDLIVANPPYVSQSEYDALPAEFKAEPSLGLISEDDGLAIPIQILNEASEYLSSNGVLIMEVGYSANLLQQKFNDIPFLWLEFANGGDGVLCISRKQLLQFCGGLN